VITLLLILKMEQDRKFFQKLSKNLSTYLISFINYHDFKELMLVNNTFVENIRWYIKHEIDKNKNLFHFYKKHIFLFNQGCSLLLKRDIIPHIKDNIGLKHLLATRSEILRNFLSQVERLILTDSNLNITSEYEGIFLENLRKDIFVYLAKMMVRNFERLGIYALYLDKSEIGMDGVEIIALVIKFSKELNYVDFSFSKLDVGEVKHILAVMEDIDGYFSLNFEGVELSLPVLKIIAGIKKKDLMKEIYIGGNKLVNVSKATKPKYKIKNFK
jgi:hypothetical protein